jgi:hypothetical protein
VISGVKLVVPPSYDPEGRGRVAAANKRFVIAAGPVVTEKVDPAAVAAEYAAAAAAWKHPDSATLALRRRSGVLFTEHIAAKIVAAGALVCKRSPAGSVPRTRRRPSRGRWVRL